MEEPEKSYDLYMGMAAQAMDEGDYNAAVDYLKKMPDKAQQEENCVGLVFGLAMKRKMQRTSESGFEIQVKEDGTVDGKLIKEAIEEEIEPSNPMRIFLDSLVKELGS